MPVRRHPLILAVLALALFAAPAPRAQDFSKVEIKTEKLAPNVSVLFGAGGNIGVFTAPDGVLLIDDQFAPLTPKIQAAVKALSAQPIKFVLNTHWHGDHAGGNETLANAGAVIFAQDNARKRLTEGQVNKLFARTVPPATGAALPIITFERDMTFHLGDETIHALHVEHAHTDGDVIVRFEKANVIHMGDTFFNQMYPIIDIESGGSLDGMIAASERGLSMIDVATKVVPGHGPMGDRKALEDYHAMLVGVRDAVKPLVAQGKTLAEVQAAKPTAPWDAQWGGGFLKPDRFVEIVFNDYSQKPVATAAPSH